ncbi:unnamed protein product, partial [Discosporangium mesarthrocarpum]
GRGVSSQVTGVDGSVLPLGQKLAKSWIVLDLGTRPPPGQYHELWEEDGGEWGLTFFGGRGGKNGIKLGLKELRQLGTRVYTEDW